MKIVRALRKVSGSVRGQSMVEYALIIALVALVLVVGLTALSGGISKLFGQITAAL